MVRKPVFAAALCIATASSNLAHGQASTTNSTIPTAGDAIKPGDIIIWSANRNILKRYEAVEPPKDAQAQTTFSPADKAAAAAALQKAAQNAVTAATDAAAFADARRVLAIADANLKNANADAYGKNSGKPTGPGTLAAAAEMAVQAQDQDTKAQTTLKDAESRNTAALKSVEEAKALVKKSPSAANKAALDKAANDAKEATAKLESSRETATADAQYLKTAINSMNSMADSALTTKPDVSVFCAPSGSRFEVKSIVAATAPSDGTTKNKSTGSSTGATVSDTQIVRGVYPNKFEPFHFRALPFERSESGAPPPGTVSPCGAGTQLASYGTVYEFTSDEVKAGAFDREGFTWGGVVVPFKFYFKDRSIKTNSSVLAYVGYEGWLSGISLAGVVGIGVGAATSSPTTSTTTSSNGTAAGTTNSTSTLATYTFGAGVIATFGGALKAGLMFGRDYQGNAATFPYENKTWMALSIGAGF